MTYGVPQGSVLGHLLFLVYINDLHKAIQSSMVHHFADDTNLLLVNKLIKKLQKQANLDLRYHCKWLKANKISLNASKAEFLISDKVPTVRTQIYGVHSIKFKSVHFWNYINKKFYDKQLHKEKRNFCKSFVRNFLLNGYKSI